MSSTILEHIRVTRKFTLLGDQKTVRWVSVSKYIYFDASKQTHLWDQHWGGCIWHGEVCNKLGDQGEIERSERNGSWFVIVFLVVFFHWDIDKGDDHSRYLELKFMLLLGDFQNMMFTIFYLGVVVLKFMLVLGESECHLSELSYLCDQGKSETWRVRVILANGSKLWLERFE